MKTSSSLVVRALAGALFCTLSISADAQERSIAPQEETLAGYKSEPPGLIAEPAVIERAVIFADRHFGNGEITSGLYADAWNMIPGAGWLAAGPGYRRWYSKDRLFVDGSAASLRYSASMRSSFESTMNP